MDFSVVILVILIVIIFIKINSESRLSKMLEKIPGPPTVPFFGNVLQNMVPKEEIIKLQMARRKLYGPIYRTWMGPNFPIVHLQKAEYFEKILGSNKLIRKGKVYKFLYPWLGTGLLTSEGSKWFNHRKMITPTFHFQILDSFIDIFNENTNTLIKRLKEVSKRRYVDIYPYITLCALDIICETAMGTKVNAQKEEDSTYVAALYKIAELTVKRANRIWYFSDTLFYMSSTGRQYKKNVNIVHHFTESIIKERKLMRSKNQTESFASDVGIKKKQAFLDLLLDSSNKSGTQLTDEELRDEVDTFMFEGHDTTTTAICWSLLLLGENTKIQEEVYQELKMIFHDDPKRNATMKDLNQMKLLERVIKETLRLFPSVPVISRTIDEDVQLDKYVLPKGTSVSLHIYFLHHDETVFPNPYEFNPDNFLPDAIQKRHPYAYVPFSAGPRNCIGQKFAILEEKAVLSNILRNFRVESLQRKEDLTVVNELVLRPAGGIKLKFHERN